MTKTSLVQTAVSQPPVPAVVDLIGRTPLLHLTRVVSGVPNSVEVYAKAEWFNPGGSVKDRAAWHIIREGEQAGYLPSRILLDATSGNTGVAYAMIAAARGHRLTVVMPENVSEERKRIVGAYGGEIIFTSRLEGSDGAIVEARRLAAEYPARYWYADQYNNPANSRAHYETTAVEIWEQTGGQVTHFVAGAGTGGTVSGTSRRLKEFNSDISVFSVQPSAGLHGLEGLKHMETAIRPSNYQDSLLDGEMFVETEEAYEWVRRLGLEEGLLVGYSSGAAMAAAFTVASQLAEGVVVTVFPDSGDRYLSSRFWE